MMFLVPIFIVGFITLGIYKILELYAKKKERTLLIEKLASLVENEGDEEKRLKIQIPFIIGNDSISWSLRISLLLIGVGAGCLLAFFVRFNSSIESYDLIAMINFASISFFGGIGLLAAFLIEQKMKAKK